MHVPSPASGILGLLLTSSTLLSQGCLTPGTPREYKVLRTTPLFSFSEHEVDRYLRRLADEVPGTINRVALLARQNIDQPYRLGLLGEYPFEFYDPDPLYCLSSSDCVTFVEQTYAMALAHDWPSFMNLLMRIRYRDGVIGLATRNHFLEADWNVNNAWLFEDVTASLADRAPARPMRVRIDRAALLARHGRSSDTPVQFWDDVYFPLDSLSAALPGLRPGDIVEIVKGSDDRSYVSHVGIILQDQDANPTIIHATRPAVREEVLEAYLERVRGVSGIKVLRLREPPSRRMSG